MTDPLPDFAFDPSARAAACENCGAGPDADLRFVILRARTRYLGRTLCDHCAESALEAFIASEPEHSR